MTAVAAPATVQTVWQALEAIPDPEIPVVSIRELGILRDVQAHGDDSFTVYITPTYSGCPAIGQIEDDIVKTLLQIGITAKVQRQLAPAWTTDWIGPAARQKLRAYGIAPPGLSSPGKNSDFYIKNGENIIVFKSKLVANSSTILGEKSLKNIENIKCPQCNSINTTETSHFASTACKALYKCLDCQEPFDYFKPY